MKDMPNPSRTAKDCSPAYRDEVADNGPTMEEVLFALCKKTCDATGRCPLAGYTREGMCVDNWSPCVHDKRQPTVAEVLAATVPEPAKKAASSKR